MTVSNSIEKTGNCDAKIDSVNASIGGEGNPIRIQIDLIVSRRGNKLKKQLLKDKCSYQLQLQTPSVHTHIKNEEDYAFNKHWLENDGGGQLYSKRSVHTALSDG